MPIRQRLIVIIMLVIIGVTVGTLAANYLISNRISGEGDSEPIDDPSKTKDSDGDGISDWDEVHIYHTDPHNPDTDGDYVSDGIEVKLGTNPLKIDTDGGGVDDFNELYTYPHYNMDPNNAADDKALIAKIPNVVARHWEQTNGITDGGVGGYSPEKYLQISERDPLVQWYAKRAKIDLANGQFTVNGEPIWNGPPDSNESPRSIDQPSYYFTHGRKGICVNSALTNLIILQMMGNKAVEVGNEDHQWTEALIDDKVYVVNFNGVNPRDGFYEKWGWTITSSGYNPDWWKQ